MATVKELTGGTGDVNPQILTNVVQQATADVTIEEEIALPLPRFAQKGNRSMVLEILRIDLWPMDFPTVSATDKSVQYYVSTQSGPSMSNSRMFYSRQLIINFAANSSSMVPDINTSNDFSDGAGHGYLVATDSLFFGISSTVTSILNKAAFRIHYRFKEVSLAEYIGIVQSQQ